MKKTFNFSEKLWLYSGKAAWHFITLPVLVAQEIDFNFEEHKRGWGSLRVLVTVGSTSWKTSVFPDKKSNSYLLPIKTQVREKENLTVGGVVTVQLEVITN